MEEDFATLHMVVREGLIGKVTLEPRFEGGEGVSHKVSWKKTFLCKGPEVRSGLECLRNSEQAKVAERR